MTINLPRYFGIRPDEPDYLGDLFSARALLAIYRPHPDTPVCVSGDAGPIQVGTIGQLREDDLFPGTRLLPIFSSEEYHLHPPVPGSHRPSIHFEVVHLERFQLASQLSVHFRPATYTLPVRS